jgi:hypothetical protein
MPLAQSYASLPSPMQWKQDSRATPGFDDPLRMTDPGRPKDMVLTQIDHLLEALLEVETTAQAQYILGEIFFATMFWNNNHKRMPSMDSNRRPAIMRLMLYAGQTLASCFGCHQREVATKLAYVYGHEMTDHGIRADNKAAYLDRAAVEMFRVIFDGGIAWRFDCLQARTAPDLGKKPVVLDTRDYEKLQASISSTKDTRVLDAAKAGYVMTMSREFYVGPFTNLKSQLKKFPAFHSYFTAGRSVQCSGMIQIIDGAVREIDNWSGHYTPVDTALVKTLEQLRAVGMKPGNITVTGVKKEMNFNPVRIVPRHFEVNGADFLRLNGNWEALHKQAPSEISKI